MCKIILIGGGGHCLSCIETIEDIGKYTIEGILDLPENLNKKILGYQIVGTDDDIELYHRKGYQFCISLGQMSSGETIKKKIFLHLKTRNVKLPIIISPSATISRHSKIGDGTIIMSGARVNAGAEIGENCIINSNSLIEHGTFVGSHTHISTGVILNGDCSISDNCFIGSGSVLRNGITIAENSTIGMGSVVTKNINVSGLYYGNPLIKV